MTDHDYKAIADRLVELGIGLPDGEGAGYLNDDNWQKKYCHDWRVAGACMEKMVSLDFDATDDQYTVSVWIAGAFTGPSATTGDDSLPLAIILAYLGAMGDE